MTASRCSSSTPRAVPGPPRSERVADLAGVAGRRVRRHGRRRHGALLRCPSTTSRSGRLQAQTMVACLEARGVDDPRIILVDGGTDVDQNAVLLAIGAHQVLDPLVSAGRVDLQQETTVTGWQTRPAPPPAFSAGAGRLRRPGRRRAGGRATTSPRPSSACSAAGARRHGRRRPGRRCQRAAERRGRAAEHDGPHGPGGRGRRRGAARGRPGLRQGHGPLSPAEDPLEPRRLLRRCCCPVRRSPWPTSRTRSSPVL